MYERCPSGCAYSGSNNVDDVAVHVGNSGGSVADVKSKLPNELGIYDMSGNRFEWTNSLASGKAMQRGGSFTSGANNVRIVTSSIGGVYNFNTNMGFRVV
jgi:formylglycine-generating enzyme required for sulfatase activity